MEYIQELPPTKNTILCCTCATEIEPNATNMCVGCLRSRVDLTERIPKTVGLYFCRNCERYLVPPGEWVAAALESRELMNLCLKKLKNFGAAKLVHAEFIWTEPHSKRLKIKVTVQGTVLDKATMEQSFIVEYVVSNQMCNDCHRTEARDFWNTSVQVRQKAINLKTFYYLEQLILKHKAHSETISIKTLHDGIDFFYSKESSARKMVDFILSVLPCRYQHSKKLMSHDIHSNIYNYKFTYSIEIVPISKDSVVCLPKKLSQQLGNINPICLVNRVTSFVQLIDVYTGQLAEVRSTLYWRFPFNSICNPKQLIEFIVMDIEPIDNNNKKYPGQGRISNKHIISDVWLVKASELGINQNTIHARTHLGHIFKPGDSALGYLIAESNINDPNFNTVQQSGTVPDIILVKKYYGCDRAARRRQRLWKLKHLDAVDVGGSENNDYNEFLEDLEEDVELRQNVNLFRDNSKPIPVDFNDRDPAIPQVTLEEMLDDLVIDDAEMVEVGSMHK